MRNHAITPFILAVPQADFEDLNRRIDRTRWPDAETVDDWTGRPARQSQGADRSPASPLRLAPLRGDTERLVPIQDLHRRPRHPLPARPLEARERAAAVHRPRLASLAAQVQTSCESSFLLEGP